MSIREYVGARYVAKVYENTVTPGSAEWQSGVRYEPLTIVTYNYSSYLSKKAVPNNIGNPATNPDYWVVTGEYNGQIASLQSQIDATNAALNALDSNQINKQAASLYGKSMTIYGDSWAFNPNFNHWIDVLRQATGYNIKAYYGGHLATGITNNVEHAIDDYPEVSDIYLIKGGINDWNKSMPFEDVANGIKNIITKLRTLNSNAEIYFTTPVNTVYIPNDYSDATVYFPCDAYRQIIWTTCGNHNASVIDGNKIPIRIRSDGFHPLGDEDMEFYGKAVLRAIINHGDSRSFDNQYRMTEDPDTHVHTMYVMKGGRLFVQPWDTITYTNGAYVMAMGGFNKIGNLNIPPARAIVDNVGGSFYPGYNRVVSGQIYVNVNSSVNGNGAIAKNMYELELFPTVFQHGLF